MKKYLIILLVLALGISIVGCSETKEPEEVREEENIITDELENDVEDVDGEENEEEEETIDPATNTEEIEVILYFANEDYIITGDESLDKLIPEQTTIEIGDITLEEAVVRKLIEGPESDELSTSIPENVELLGVEVTDGTAFVNFAQEGLNGGSLQESFTISQIVNSLLELDNIDKVQFLIDGEEAESLMGHFIIVEPFDESF